MRGKVTELAHDRSRGCIVGENGGVIYLDKKMLGARGMRTLSVGDYVEYNEWYPSECLQARNMRRIANPTSRSQVVLNKS